MFCLILLVPVCLGLLPSFASRSLSAPPSLSEKSMSKRSIYLCAAHTHEHGVVFARQSLIHFHFIYPVGHPLHNSTHPVSFLYLPHLTSPHQPATATTSTYIYKLGSNSIQSILLLIKGFVIGFKIIFSKCILTKKWIKFIIIRTEPCRFSCIYLSIIIIK